MGILPDQHPTQSNPIDSDPIMVGIVYLGLQVPPDYDEMQDN